MKQNHPAEPNLEDQAADLVRRYADATRVLVDAQFNSEDVMRLASITKKQLEHIIDPDRSPIQLSFHDRDRKQGRRRLFTGSDALKICTAFTLTPVGFPLRFLAVAAIEIEARAKARLTGRDTTPNLVWLTWPKADGSDWIREAMFTGRTDEPKTPAAVLMVDVDRIIDETLAKLKALVADEELPDFSIPDPVPEPSIYSPENDFFRRWAKDGEGRNVLAGLTFEETQEYETLTGKERGTSTERDRFLALDEKHEGARLARSFSEIAGTDAGGDPPEGASSPVKDH